MDARWVPYFLHRALDLRIPRLVFATPAAQWMALCEDVRQTRQRLSDLLCLWFSSPAARPLDVHDKAKFYLLPIFLSLGLDVISLDLDVFMFQDPTARILETVYSKALPLDVAATDHFDGTCLNAGVLFVRASDQALLWVLHFIEWLHKYPYGHFQNGLDAFLGHSILEPQLPDSSVLPTAARVSYAVLGTDLEYVTLAGWGGSLEKQRHQALLLHFTPAISAALGSGLAHGEKQVLLLHLFNATARRPGEKEPDARRQQMAKWKVLHRLHTNVPRWRTPCYVGIHPTVTHLVESGLYEELLA
ncbi:unnamed protein product [Symbiodinium natans]|uniref:Nucleotide-diphospho-sugar transferase domain-containing protein n=1 Tax=Symbiodinium natans TaxID=878477 RepID=A0A812JDU1_9DINO|nr:unnamed protein product [Symbiodinium natans]